MRIRGGLLGTLGSLAFVATGCGSDSAPSVDRSTAEVKVTGTVKLNGNPISKGNVYFNPANIGRQVGPRSAPILEGGKYEITTLVGDNSVNVDSPAIDAVRPKLGRQGTSIRVESGSAPVDLNLPFPK